MNTRKNTGLSLIKSIEIFCLHQTDPVGESRLAGTPETVPDHKFNRLGWIF